MPVVNTTRTFTNNEQITSTKLNEIMDNSLFVAGAVVSGGGLEITTGGQMQIPPNAITSSRISANAVTTNAILNGSIVPEKLSSGGPTWTTSTTSVTRGLAVGGKITSSVAESYVDFNTVFPLTAYETRIKRDSGANGVFTITNNGTGAIVMNASGGVTFGSANMPVPSGSAPIYGVRAWAKLNILVGSDRTTAFKSGSYSRNTTETTITGMADHGLKVNDRIRLDFTSGDGVDGLYRVTEVPSTSSFVVNHSSTSTSGLVTAQFVKIQASGNISSASFYDTSDNRVVLNFQTPMPNVNYTVIGSGHHYPSEYYPGVVGEDTSTGTSQLNTVNQAYIYGSNWERFASVIILG